MQGASMGEYESSIHGDCGSAHVGGAADMSGAMVDVMVAQRAHTASINAMKVAHQMLRDVAELGSA